MRYILYQKVHWGGGWRPPRGWKTVFILSHWRVNKVYSNVYLANTVYIVGYKEDIENIHILVLVN